MIEVVFWSSIILIVTFMLIVYVIEIRDYLKAKEHECAGMIIACGIMIGLVVLANILWR